MLLKLVGALFGILPDGVAFIGAHAADFAPVERNYVFDIAQESAAHTLHIGVIVRRRCINRPGTLSSEPLKLRPLVRESERAFHGFGGHGGGFVPGAIGGDVGILLTSGDAALCRCRAMSRFDLRFLLLVERVVRIESGKFLLLRQLGLIVLQFPGVVTLHVFELVGSGLRR